MVLTDAEKQLYKNLLKKATFRKKDYVAREYYWNCIKNTGYSLNENEYPLNPPENNSNYESEDPYDVFKTMEGRTPVQANKPEYTEYSSRENVGVAESRQMYMADEYGFNRTFIEPLDNNGITSSGNRLSELDTWINVSSEETEFKKIVKLIEEVLNVLNTSENLLIRKFAMNMYWNILQYYKTNTLKLPLNKGNLRLGYIVLVIYYAFVYFKKPISTESIIRVVPNSRINYIPDAKKYIKQIFLKSPNYSFLNAEFSENISSECNNLIKTLPNNIQVIINKINEHFGSTGTTIHIAAVIYYVTSVPLSKGGILQKRLVLENNKKITTEFLINKCGKIAPATLSKIVNNIINFYNNNPLIKAELMN